MIKFCVFDIGQVCYAFSLEPLNDFCRSLSKDKDVFDKKSGVKSFDYRSFMKGEIGFDIFCQKLCAHCGIEYYQKIDALIDEAMHRGVGEFFAATIGVMKALRQRGVEICLLSNALPNLADTAVNMVDRDKVFVSYELGLLKPDAKIYQKVLQKLGAQPQEVIFIDDKPRNVKAAEALGICGIVFNEATLAEDVERLFKA